MGERVRARPPYDSTSKSTRSSFSSALIGCACQNSGSRSGMRPPGQFPDEQTPAGEFTRQEDAFRHWIRSDGTGSFPPAAGRYHLYMSLACPWAHRTLIVRHLKRLEAAIGVTVVDPVRDERGWAFRDG